MKIMFAILAGILCLRPAASQEIPEQYLEHQTELAEQDIEEDSYLQLLEQYRHEPLDLNRAGESELIGIRMLTPLQISSFLSYRRLLGALISRYELQSIPHWDLETIKKILPYVSVHPLQINRQEWTSWFKEGRHEAVLRFSVIPERSKGFINAVYTGSPIRIFFRHRYQYKNILQYGIVGDKDAGEAFFRGAQAKGFDFYSFHLFARKLGRVAALAIGDYTVNMGQGLIHWQGLAFRYGAEGIKRQSEMMKPYNSAGEYDFHRGIGVTVEKKKLRVTTFFSLRKLSANRSYDTLLKQEVITSINTSGYHRSQSELIDRHILDQLCYGSSISFRQNNFHAGINTVHYRFSLPLLKKNEPYNLYEIRGREWKNYSADYGFTFRNMHVFGEWAVDKNFSHAVLKGLMISADSKVDITLLYRKIDKAYRSVNGSAHTKNSSPSNESGLYAAVCLRPGSNWRIDASMDLFHFPWLKARVNSASSGNDLTLQFQHTPSRQMELTATIKYEKKEINGEAWIAGMHPIIELRRYKWKAQLIYRFNTALVLKSRFEFIRVVKDDGYPKSGFLGFMDISYAPMLKSLSGHVRLAIFETDDYDTRLYAYENDVLFYHSIPALYDRGYRGYVTANYALSSRLTIGLKLSRSVYPGKSAIGTGNEEIGLEHRTEGRFQVRIIF